MVNIGKSIRNNKLAHDVDRIFQIGIPVCMARVQWENCMIFRRWGICALTLFFGFSMVPVGDAQAARSVASSKQVKKKTVAAKRVATKKRSVVSAAPVFRPPKPPAQRHYAVDGSTFYADGVRVRAAGLEKLETTSVAKQRLQQILDSGRVSIEPLGRDGPGDATLARVRIDGRDLSEMARPH
jgi:hypothetical protein